MNESLENNAERVLTIISGTGISTFSKPQALSDLSSLNLSDYVEGKISEGTLFTLFDIENTIRGFYVGLDGEVTKTFLEGFLDFFERRLRHPMLFLDDKVYFIVKDRLGPGEFEIKHAVIDLADFSRLDLSGSVYDIMKELEDNAWEVN